MATSIAHTQSSFVKCGANFLRVTNKVTTKSPLASHTHKPCVTCKANQQPEVPATELTCEWPRDEIIDNLDWDQYDPTGTTGPALPWPRPGSVALVDADGSVVELTEGSPRYYNPLEDFDTVGTALEVFKGGRASEVVNGRVAMVGFTAALMNELINSESVFTQLWNVRIIRDSLSNDSFRELLLPKMGMFLVPATAIIVLAASLTPVFKGRKDNGLSVPAEPYGPFTTTAETFNGRAAMIGLVALTLVENTNGLPFF